MPWAHFLCAICDGSSSLNFESFRRYISGHTCERSISRFNWWEKTQSECIQHHPMWAGITDWISRGKMENQPNINIHLFLLLGWLHPVSDHTSVVKMDPVYSNCKTKYSLSSWNCFQCIFHSSGTVMNTAFFQGQIREVRRWTHGHTERRMLELAVKARSLDIVSWVPFNMQLSFSSLKLSFHLEKLLENPRKLKNNVQPGNPSLEHLSELQKGQAIYFQEQPNDHPASLVTDVVHQATWIY